MAKKEVSEGDLILVAKDAAEEVNTPAQPAPQGKIFSEDEVEKIRQQEKDKMYKRLEEADQRVRQMEEQMSVIAQEREAARKEAEEKAKKEQQLLRQREIDELSAKELLMKTEEEFTSKLQNIESDYQRRFSEIEAQRQAQEALLEKERSLQEINSYRQRRLSEEQESIIPELLDLVSGSTQEEIETSIQILRERSSAIIESIQQTTQQQQGRLRGTQVTAPPVGPMETQTEYQTLTAEDIRNMPMDKYIQMRDRLLNARPQRGRY
jgi:hypothetical protein